MDNTLHQMINMETGSSRFQRTRQTLEYHWSNYLPPLTREFILNESAPDGGLSLRQLVDFWSTKNLDAASAMSKSSWYLALVYLAENKYREATALTITGSFLHQCDETGIEYIKDICKSGAWEKLPYFMDGLYTATNPNSLIKPFINRHLSDQPMPYSNLSEGQHVLSYVDEILSDEWEGSRKNHKKKLRKDEGSPIQLIFVDDTNEDLKHIFSIGSASKLKGLFHDYAEERGISLRCLRFAYASKVLFLSSAGKKTPEELGMKDQDIIMVHDTSKPTEEAQSTTNNQKHLEESSNKCTKKGKGKAAKKKQRCKDPEAKQSLKLTDQEPTEEELKIEHSKILSKLHEELEPRLKQIRQRLNNLVLERSRPKIRSHMSKNKASSFLHPIEIDHLEETSNGKAGKSHFVVQVGEAEHFYKTSKPSNLGASFQNNVPTLDLHGYTRDDAIAKLDESLSEWIDVAMKGCYPFVIQVVIVCGCGNQILSATVQEWIKSRHHVSNAPKMRYL